MEVHTAKELLLQTGCVKAVNLFPCDDKMKPGDSHRVVRQTLAGETVTLLFGQFITDITRVHGQDKEEA